MRMNKKFLASLIAVGILSTGTALANPFDDVAKDHWSYDAVQTLADQGIVDGYGDGTFRGDKLMTRYEMAQIVGRAISRGKLAGPESKATIDKLSLEYADELNALGIRVDNIEKKTAGVNDLKISHWFQTENTYGDVTDPGDDSAHEYEIEYRLTAEKQISPKLSALMQIETKAYWDTPSAVAGGTDGVYTRLAYITYKPNEKTSLQAGKNAYWLAGGLLGDDYLKSINFTAQLDDKTSVQLLHGRYWTNRDIPNGVMSDVWVPDNPANPSNGHWDQVEGTSSLSDNQINYLGVNTKFGKVDFGAHYLTGKYSIVNQKENTRIWAATAGTDLGRSGVNLSVGYAENSEEDDNNRLGKVQLYKKFGKTDAFLQYWRQEGNINLPMENGNHMAWWGDMFSERGKLGVEGWRLILGHTISENCYAEAWYGDYDTILANASGDKESAKKFGWALTFQY